MKFSDLVVLGSTVIRLEASTYLEDGCGCFIGMAAAAKTGAETYGDMQYKVADLFPWLQEQRKMSCPVCETEFRSPCGSISCLAVHVQFEDTTFEKALEYIRSIEPEESAHGGAYEDGIPDTTAVSRH